LIIFLLLLADVFLPGIGASLQFVADLLEFFIEEVADECDFVIEDGGLGALLDGIDDCLDIVFALPDYLLHFFCLPLG
jgi:hypothetical protein